MHGVKVIPAKGAMAVVRPKRYAEIIAQFDERVTVDSCLTTCLDLNEWGLNRSLNRPVHRISDPLPFHHPHDQCEAELCARDPGISDFAKRAQLARPEHSLYLVHVTDCSISSDSGLARREDAPFFSST